MSALSCIDCGDDYTSRATHNPSPRCTDCRAERRRETNRHAKQRAPRVVRAPQAPVYSQRRHPDFTEIAAHDLGLDYHTGGPEARSRIVALALVLRAAKVPA